MSENEKFYKKPFRLLQAIEPCESSWTVVSMNFVGSLPVTKNGHSSTLSITEQMIEACILLGLDLINYMFLLSMGMQARTVGKCACPCDISFSLIFAALRSLL